MSSVCPRCGTAWAGPARWCGRCGTALPGGTPTDPPDATTGRSSGRVGRRRRRILALGMPLLLVGGLAVADLAGSGPPELAASGDPSPSGASGEVVVPGEVDAPAGGPGDDTSSGSDANLDPAGLAWERATGPDPILDAHATDDTIVALDGAGRVTGVDLVDGTLRWHRHLDIAPADARPGDRADDPTRELHDADAAPDHLGDAGADRSVTGKGEVLRPLGDALVIRHRGVVSAIDPGSGDLRWTRQVPAEAVTMSTGRTLLVAAGDTVTTVDRDGQASDATTLPDGAEVHLHPHGAFVVLDGETVRALDPEGRVRWEQSFDAPVRPLPTTSADGAPLLAIDGPEPRLVAVAPADGSPRWEIDVDGEITHVTVGGFRTLIGVRRDGGVDVLLALLDEFGRAEVRRQLRVDDVERLAQLSLIGRQIVAVTDAPDPAVLFATPDAFLRSQERGAGEVRSTAQDTRTVLIADADGVRAIALATGQQRFAVPLADARPVPGAPTVFFGDGRLLRVAPSPS